MGGWLGGWEGEMQGGMDGLVEYLGVWKGGSMVNGDGGKGQ